MYRIFTVCFGFALGLSISGVSGCSSNDSTGPAGSKDYSPPTDGVSMSEASACQAIAQARSARRQELACGPATEPACPALISAGHPSCSSYDHGTVQGCVDYYSGLSCSELSSKHCIVQAIEGSAPNGCDSGNDAGSDAAQDAASDVTGDEQSDAPAEAGSDAAGD